MTEKELLRKLMEEEARDRERQYWENLSSEEPEEEDEQDSPVCKRFDCLMVGRLPGAYGRMRFSNIREDYVLLMRQAAIRNGYDFEVRCLPGELPDMTEDTGKPCRVVFIRDGKNKITIKTTNEEMFALLIAACGNHLDFTTFTEE